MATIEETIQAFNDFLNRLPDIIAEEVIDWVLDNFDSQSFEGRPWPERKDGDTTRALLIGERGGFGRRSIRVTSRTKSKIEIGTDLEYMIAHNEGAEITRQVTPKMRKFFWAMHYKYEEGAKDDQIKWKWMALMKGKTITFKMPQRQFIGPSKELDDRLKEAITYHLNNLFT